MTAWGLQGEAAASGDVKRIRIRCRVSGTNPEVDSVTGIWRSSNWYERECFDMFGIGFRNHPNLIRILMPLDWEGHPLRKDYPKQLEQPLVPYRPPQTSSVR